MLWGFFFGSSSAMEDKSRPISRAVLLPSPLCEEGVMNFLPWRQGEMKKLEKFKCFLVCTLWKHLPGDSPGWLFKGKHVSSSPAFDLPSPTGVFNSSLLPRWFIWVYEGCFLYSRRASGQKQPRNFAKKWNGGSWFSLCGGCLEVLRGLSIPTAGTGVCLREINDLCCFLHPWLSLSTHVL